MIGKKGGESYEKKIAGVISSSTACRFVLHQPAMPDKMKKLLGEK